MSMRTAHRGPFADLATYLADTGDTQAHIAKAVGSSQAHISRIAAGELVPRPRLAMRLAAYCRIPLDSFTRRYVVSRRDRRRDHSRKRATTRVSATPPL
jgi:transcriptional regulator with XRE-family HTH domain